MPAGSRAGARPRLRRPGARSPRRASHACTRPSAGAGTDRRDPSLRRPRAGAHGSRARRPERRDRGRAQPPRACRPVGAERKVVVREPVDQCRGFGAGYVPSRSVRYGVREGGHGKRIRRQRGVSYASRSARGTPGPVVHRLVPRAVELVHRQLDQQPDGLDGGRLRQAAKSRHEPHVGLLVSSEEALQPGARRRDRRAEGA